MTIQDKSTLVSNITRDLADNATQDISPRDVRQNLLDIIDSVHNLTDGQDLTGKNFSTPAVRTTRGGQESLSKLHLDGYVSIDNTAYGYSSLSNNYIGSGNTAIGAYSNSCNLYGSNNASLGYASLGINIYGKKNVALGAYALHGTRQGDFNIAIGHGAGYYIGSGDHYKFYLGAHNVSGDAGCDLTLYGSGMPLIYGELDTLRMGIGVNSLHDYGSLQVSGGVAPNLTEAYHLGHNSYKWKSINQKINFSGDAIGIGTESPSGTIGLVTVQGNILPKSANVHALGSEDLKWDGFFNDIVVSGTAKINAYTYNEIQSCTYECRTIYLAASGQCDGFPGVCGYMQDEEVEGGGFVLRSSGTGYRRDYEFTYKAPNSSLTCLESDTAYSRSSWNSNISIHIASGRHLMTDRVIGPNESLSMVTSSGCAGLFIENLQTGTEANRMTFGMSTVKAAVSSKLTEVNFLDSGNANFLSSMQTVGSGAQVGHKMMSRGNESNSHGFSSFYTDANDIVTTTQGASLPPDGTATVYSAGGANTIPLGYQKNDRYSLTSHVGSTSRYAITVMKDPTFTISSGRNTTNYNKWQVNPDAGVLGVSNYSSEKLPKTIVNVQSTGDFSIRGAAPDGYVAKLELLSGPNDVNNWVSSGTATDAVRDGASFGGLVMEYLPSGGYREYWSSGNPTDPASSRIYRRRHAIIGLVTGDNIGGSQDQSYVDLTDDGYEGFDSITDTSATRWPHADYTYKSYITFSESGVGVNNSEAHAPLTVDGDVNKDTSSRGGVIAMRIQESGTAPRLSRDYGKFDFGDLVASGYSIADQHSFGQASTLWYCDASGNNFELISNPLNPKNTTSFVSNASGNTFLGYNAPQNRSTWLTNGYQRHNSAYGFEALTWGQYTQFSTAIGSRALLNLGSGIATGSGCVGVGYNAGANMIAAVNSIAIGNNSEAHNNSNSITIGPNISSGVFRASHDYSLLVGGGDGNILLYGKMGPSTSDKELTVVQAQLKVTSSTESDSLIIKHDQNAFGTDKVATVINKRDVSADHPDGGLVFTFTGANGNENTLMSMRHTDVPMSDSNSFSASSPARPLVGVSGDINVLGRINFADGSSMDTNASGVAPNPGVGLSLSVVSGVNTFDTNIEELALAESQNAISDMNSYMYISTNNSVGKINISSLAGYIEVSGAARVLSNQNHVFSNTSIIDPTINQYLHVLGYKAGHGLIESDSAVMLGPEAGSYSTTAVSGVDSSVFIGNRAGYNANAADNSVFIGPNAGNDADDSRMSVFVGNSAGRTAKSDYSIGIGNNALEAASGSYNVEIIAKQEQKLVVGTQSNRLNIGGTIAGSTLTQRVSVGDATIVPSAVLHVNYNSTTHAATSNMQEWHVDGVKKASVNTFGAFDNVVEGVLDTDLWAPTAPTSPTSGEMILYGQNWTSGIHIFVTNRDSSLSGYDGAYIMAVKIGSEYRPMWMGCQGT